MIVAARGIAREQLADPDVLARLQEEMTRGDALHKIDLLEQIDRLRRGTSEGVGKRDPREPPKQAFVGPPRLQQEAREEAS